MSTMAAEKTQNRRQAVAERNVEAILDAAEQLLQRRSPVSIAAVAREARVSRVTVYSHFATKEELLEAVAARAVRGAAAAVESAEPDRGPPLDALERMISVSWRQLERGEAIRRAVADELGSAAMWRAHQSAIAPLHRLIERGREQGAFRSDLPEQWLIVSFIALLHAAADEVREGRIEAQAAASAVTTTIRELFTGS
jgi:TetR/AcrR family transcriptional repressor of mexCD-oprJ operon